MIETLLPERRQRVLDLDTGDIIHALYLSDEFLAALERRLGILQPVLQGTEDT